MRTVSPPAELMTEVAQQLLASAEALGLRPEVVATTTGTEFGYGFVVPGPVFDHWFLRRGEAAGMSAPEVTPSEPGEFLVPLGPEVPFGEEFPATEVTVGEAPEVPEVPVAVVPDEKPKRRSRGVAKNEEEA